MEYNQVNFVIVGGGTAGWITALKIRKYFPDNKITLIESSEIGILGAGEGTTPHFVNFLNEVDININYFIKNTKATFKEGIKFTNWHGDGSYFMHPFADGPKYSVDHNLKIKNLAEGKNIDEYVPLYYVAKDNKTRYYQDGSSFHHDGSVALHFDARLTAEFLKSIALNRNVNVIDANVVDFDLDDKNNIAAVVLENNLKVECDFVFDCTGFARKIVGGLYKQKWLDYQQSLPVNKAFPFFIKNDSESIPPYTEAIAMKYGWVWKIPVQGRFGCGYVFDDRYITDEEAKTEILSTFGEVDMPRPTPFSFKAGYYENTWVNNCICIGLSSGFIEPLEATSIWVTLLSLDFLVKESLPSLLDSSIEDYKTLYNDYVRDFNDEVKAFIQLHYLTDREDSKFWCEYRTKNIIVDRLKKFDNAKTIYNLIEIAKKEFPAWDPFYVFAGVKFYPQELCKIHYDTFVKIPRIKEIIDTKESFIEECKFFAYFKAIDHYKFIEHINSLK